MWFVPVEHEGPELQREEVEMIAKIVEGLLSPEVEWFYSKGNKRVLRKRYFDCGAVYAQVADLSARLPGMNIGTVDKFQGQEAPAVIYSMATSSPEDAPRGWSFVQFERLNVATSRAMSAVIWWEVRVV